MCNRRVSSRVAGTARSGNQTGTLLLTTQPAPHPPYSSSLRGTCRQTDCAGLWPLQTRKCVGDCYPGDAAGLGRHSSEQRGPPDCGPGSCSPGWPEWRRMAWKRPLMPGSLRSKGWTLAPSLEPRQRGPVLPRHSLLSSILTLYFETQKRANKIPPASG